MIIVIAIVLGLLLVGLGIWLLLQRPGQGSVEIKFPVAAFAGPVGVFLIVLGVACVIAARPVDRYFASEPGPPTTSPISSEPPPPAPTTVPMTSSSASSPVPGPPKVEITAPADRTAVSSSRGFVAEGTVTGALGSYSIWLLDEAGGYTVDLRATVQGNHWSAVDRPLGSATDPLPFDLSAVAVLASPDCATKLRHAVDATDSHLDELPAECEIADRITVVVNRR